MADHSLIDAYLTELRYSVRHLPDADEIVAEAADHLLTALGISGDEAEVIARFGSAAIVAKVCAEESKRGGAVSTQSTRYAGAAAMSVPVLIALGMAGNFGIERGPLHGVAVGLLLVAFVTFTVAMWGLRKRHGGLGRIGKAALLLFFVSPLMAAPFGWAAGVVFIAVQLLVLTLVGVGMYRARILPPVAVALFTFAPTTSLVLSFTIFPGFLFLGVLLSAVGLGWVGWCLWREPALDIRGRGAGPLATA